MPLIDNLKLLQQVLVLKNNRKAQHKDERMRDMIVKPVTFMSEGMQLVGMLHLPEGKKKSPIVIFNHGWTGNHLESHRIFRYTCIELCKEGIAGLRFSRRGHGDSDGDFSDITVTGEIIDLKAAIDFVCTLPEIDAGRIGVIGYSHGGTIVICHAAEDKRVKAVLTWASSSGDPLERYLETEEGRSRLEKWKKGETVTFSHVFTGIWQLKAKFYEDLVENHDKFNNLNRVKEISPSPVCFIHGENDPIVPERSSYKLYLSAKEPKELMMIPGKSDIDMHHWRDLEGTAKLYKETVGWFKKVFFTPEKVKGTSTKWQ